MLSLLAVLLLITAAPRGPLTRELTVDGVQRRALVYPGRNSGEQPAPLVFVFHGHGGNGRNASRSMAIHQEWPEATVVYPDGLPTPTPVDLQGARPGWQRSPGQQDDRDLKFFDALLADIRTR